MRLIAVAVRRGHSRLLAFVRDNDGTAKRVDYKWTSLTRTDVPPTVWSKAVEAELRQQKAVSQDVLSTFRKQR